MFHTKIVYNYSIIPNPITNGSLPPTFPPPFVVDRVRQLGFGSGPWTREQIVARMGGISTTADKFIFDAKQTGWLVSPSRGMYRVPPAQDLMVVGWLPAAHREEFLIARNLAAANLNYWCFSAWCRRQGLDLGAPIFITDLAPPGQARDNETQDLRAWIKRARDRAASRGTLPFPEALLIVPQMPSLGALPTPEFALVPEDPDTESRKRRERDMARSVSGLVSMAMMALRKEAPDSDEVLQDLETQDVESRGIPFTLGPRLKDANWAVAVLAALGTARTEEFVTRYANEHSEIRRTLVQQWAQLIGPPQPNDNWKNAILDGPFPFMLVPPPLWKQMGADQASRRFRTLSKLGDA